MGIIKSYKELRATVGIIGILLPFALMLWIWIAGEQLPKSISCTYFTSARNLLVGSMSAVALFMFFYSGYNKFENWLGHFAGLFSLGVAFLPCDGATRLFHLISAFLLFSIFATFCLQFRKGNKHKLLYLISFLTIIFSMAMIPITKDIFFWETIMLIAFGVSWLVKSKTII